MRAMEELTSFLAIEFCDEGNVAVSGRCFSSADGLVQFVGGCTSLVLIQQLFGGRLVLITDVVENHLGAVRGQAFEAATFSKFWTGGGLLGLDWSHVPAAMDLRDFWEHQSKVQRPGREIL